MFEASNPSYRGPERRALARRGAADRRQSIRFEPGNEDRRQGTGRRETDLSSHIWQREL